MTNTLSNLLHYRLTLADEENFQFLFDCSAEDDDHAWEQAQNAYPGCRLVKINPNASWLIYSLHEVAMGSGKGFWSGTAWVGMEDARIFSGADREKLTLPLSTADDARWVPVEHFKSTEAIAPGSMMHLSMVLTVSYLSNGVTSDELQQKLKDVINVAIGEGRLTDSSAAYVEEWNAIVTEIPEPGMNLTEDDIADWIASQVGSGTMALEDIPLLMARYALRSPAEMRAEFAERMGLLT